jgi:hypothetical protein
MLLFLRTGGKASERKFWLFVVAVCRRIQYLLDQEYVRRCRDAIDVWTRYAEGLATDEELRTATGGAVSDAWDAPHAIAHPGDVEYYAVSSAAEAVEHARDAAVACRAAARAVAYDILSRTGDDTVAAISASWGRQTWQGRPQWNADEARVAGTPAFLAAHAEECIAQCNLLRDLFGPLPFREVHIDPAWLIWNGGTVRKLAEAVYEQQSFPDGTLEVDRLADALEEASCADAQLLAHLRLPGPHVRGCFALDAVLGKR